MEKKGEMYDEDIYVDNYVKNIKCVNTKLINKTKISDEVPTINAKESKIMDSISFCIFCKKCDEGYFLDDDNCIKQCEIGENEKCNSCNPQYPKYCQSCNEN